MTAYEILQGISNDLGIFRRNCKVVYISTEFKSLNLSEENLLCISFLAPHSTPNRNVKYFHLSLSSEQSSIQTLIQLSLINDLRNHFPTFFTD